MSLRVAFPGSAGAFSEDAVRVHFGGRPTAVPTPGFDATLDALRDERVDYCVLPVANSIAGPIVESRAALAAAPWIAIVSEFSIPVSQCLLGLTGARPGDVTRVLSHPMALAQCQRFFANHPGLAPVPHADTAGAARVVAERGDAGTAAIASRRAASLYGLTVLAADIHDRHPNTTRFVVVRREASCPVQRYEHR